MSDDMYAVELRTLYSNGYSSLQYRRRTITPEGLGPWGPWERIPLVFDKTEEPQ